MPDIPHLNNLESVDDPPKIHIATQEDIANVLSKKRGRSSPGPSSIR